MIWMIAKYIFHKKTGLKFLFKSVYAYDLIYLELDTGCAILNWDFWILYIFMYNDRVGGWSNVEVQAKWDAIFFKTYKKIDF